MSLLRKSPIKETIYTSNHFTYIHVFNIQYRPAATHIHICNEISTVAM